MVQPWIVPRYAKLALQITRAASIAPLNGIYRLFLRDALGRHQRPSANCTRTVDPHVQSIPPVTQDGLATPTCDHDVPNLRVALDHLANQLGVSLSRSRPLLL